MKYVIFSDIHSNLQAFEAVVKSFPKRKNIEIVCAGDVVGYGADPAACVEMMLSLGARNVLGNHDAAVAGKADPVSMNIYARAAALWTIEHLDGSSRDYLDSLPLVLESGSFVVVHGTLHEPEGFLYMMSNVEAIRTFDILKAQICFVGHSHKPEVFISKDGRSYRSFKKKIDIEAGNRYIINVGSVGQPRDGDERACYCVYDPEKGKIEFHRVKYDVKSARKSIINAGLPEELGNRLLIGR